MIAENDTENLVDRIKGKDKKAEQQFCEAFYTSTLNLIRRMVREPILAEDLTQEALLTVLLKLRAGKVEQSQFLGRYVRQTAKFTTISWYRKRANQEHAPLEEVSVQDLGARAEEVVFDDERREIVVELLNSLSVSRDREVLTRHYLKEEEKLHICEEKGLTSQHFDRVISRARLRCKQLVAQANSSQFTSLLSGV